MNIHLFVWLLSFQNQIYYESNFGDEEVRLGHVEMIEVFLLQFEVHQQLKF